MRGCCIFEGTVPGQAVSGASRSVAIHSIPHPRRTHRYLCVMLLYKSHHPFDLRDTLRKNYAQFRGLCILLHIQPRKTSPQKSPRSTHAPRGKHSPRNRLQLPDGAILCALGAPKACFYTHTRVPCAQLGAPRPAPRAQQPPTHHARSPHRPTRPRIHA